jgi:hypothetical protein
VGVLAYPQALCSLKKAGGRCDDDLHRQAALIAVLAGPSHILLGDYDLLSCDLLFQTQHREESCRIVIRVDQAMPCAQPFSHYPAPGNRSERLYDMVGPLEWTRTLPCHGVSQRIKSQHESLLRSTVGVCR